MTVSRFPVRFSISGSASVAAALVLVLTGAGLSQRIDWSGQDLLRAGYVGQAAPSEGMLVENEVASPEAAPSGVGLRNMQAAEAAFRFPALARTDVSPAVRSLPDAGAMPGVTPLLPGVPLRWTPFEQDRVRIAYLELLSSMQEAAMMGGDGVPGPIPAARADLADMENPASGEVAKGEPVAPIPHVRMLRGDGPEQVDPIVTASLTAAGETGAGGHATPVAAPVPMPAFMRPVVPVAPRNLDLIAPARDVSLDHMVAVDAPGSWPRRLDQINMAVLDGGQVQNGQHRFHPVRRFRRLPNGFILVLAGN
ncbi:MAG TPA: hypothetical protein ENJ68_04340 [Devosia sp.]|nr:hypothetical protein [Devosia sp.]